jgi:bromodomain-containing protein 8
LQNWLSVARIVRHQFEDEDRPPDWYSGKNCALQYNRLMEVVEKPARKKKRPSGQGNI